MASLTRSETHRHALEFLESCGQTPWGRDGSGRVAHGAELRFVDVFAGAEQRGRAAAKAGDAEDEASEYAMKLTKWRLAALAALETTSWWLSMTMLHIVRSPAIHFLRWLEAPDARNRSMDKPSRILELVHIKATQIADEWTQMLTAAGRAGWEACALEGPSFRAVALLRVLEMACDFHRRVTVPACFSHPLRLAYLVLTELPALRAATRAGPGASQATRDQRPAEGNANRTRDAGSETGLRQDGCCTRPHRRTDLGGGESGPVVRTWSRRLCLASGRAGAAGLAVPTSGQKAGWLAWVGLPAVWLDV